MQRRPTSYTSSDTLFPYPTRFRSIQLIANVGCRTPLADHAVDGGVGTRKGGIVRQAAVAAHLGLVGRLRRLGRGRGGHDIALVVRFQRGARIDRLQLLLTEILGQWRDAPGRVGNAAEDRKSTRLNSSH